MSLPGRLFAVGFLALELVLLPRHSLRGEQPPAEGEEEKPATAAELVKAAAEDLRVGEYAEAASAFEKALGLEPENAAAARGRSEALVATGKYDEALRGLQSFPKHDASAVTTTAAGRIHLRRGALAEAESAFRAAIRLDPGAIEARNRLGEALWRSGKTEEAQATWRGLIELYENMSTDDFERLPAAEVVEMGLALVGLNRYQEASKIMFEQAEEKDPKCPELLLEWGRALKDKYNYEQAPQILREAIDQNRNFADALVAFADYYLTDFQVGTKRYELAEKHLTRALEVNPNHAEGHTMRGSLWLTDGNLERAEGDFSRALSLDPSSLRARGLLAACHFLRGEEEKLAAAEKEALAVNPRGAQFFHTAAMALETRFRYADVVRFCDRALAIAPDYWPAYVTLAINCLRTGEEARGREFLEKAWKQDPYNVWVFNTRKLLAHMDKNYKELKTERFVFKFPEEDYEALALYLVPLLEEAYDKLSAHYKVELRPPVYIEAFSEHKWFSARTIGLEGFAASGACFGNLVTLTTPRALPENFGAVAWHEFAHVVTLALTRHRVPRWLTEGLSVFEEGRDHPRWARVFERDIAEAFASGRLLPIGELDYGFSKPKYPNQILISYFQGCLIATYIKEKWGWDAILGILKGYADNKSTGPIFQEVLGLSLDEFDKEFFARVERWVEANGYEPLLEPDIIPKLELEVEADPGSAARLVRLAWAYYSAGNDVDAPLTAKKVQDLDPENGDAFAVLGLDAHRGKRTAAAKELLARAAERGTRYDYHVQAALGAIAEKAGEKGAAAEHYEKAKEISPRAGAGYSGPGPGGGGNLYYRLHDLYNELGEEERAIAQMEALAVFAVEDARCRRLIAGHYLKAEGEEAARKAFGALSELVYINPFDKRLHERLAMVAAKVGEHDVTIREYGYLLHFPDTNPKIAHLALARAQAARGRSAEAAASARKVLEIDPENEEAKAILEQASRGAGEPKPEKP